MINIVTALQCEAKALIRHYQLKGESSAAGFPLYRNETMRLIVTGVGKMNCAAACAYLYARHGEIQDEAWLNLGIAGHASAALGTPLLMHKVTDQGSGLSWYPPLLFDAPCATTLCLSVEQPCDNYPGEGCVEMEAAGFYSSASRFATAELIHCLKIVSDNPASPATQINQKNVQAWVTQQLPLIEQLIGQLQTMSHELKQQHQPSPALAPFLQRWHFTSYQENQLQQHLQRWQALCPQRPPQVEDFQPCKKSKAVLSALQEQLDAMPVLFEPSP